MMSRKSDLESEELSSTAINKINSLFYSSVDGVFEKSGLADFFIKIDPVQIAFAKKIEKLIPKSLIRVKELGAGTDTTRWRIITRLKSKKKWKVTLTDFSNKSIPNTNFLSRAKNFSFQTKKYNLLKPLNKLKVKEKFDVILITYGFDSVWLPQDLHLEKKNGKWHRAKYKVNVNSCPKKELLERALESGVSTENLRISDFKHIKIKKVLEKVNMGSLKYGRLISDYYDHKLSVTVNFPGGLTKKVSEAFKNQIARGGMFILGDMAVNSKAGYVPKDSAKDKNIYMKDYQTSGRVAKFKVEDYGLAKAVLESEGFEVELETIEDFIKNSGSEAPLPVKDHWIMTVRNPD